MRLQHPIIFLVTIDGEIYQVPYFSTFSLSYAMTFRVTRGLNHSLLNEFPPQLYKIFTFHSNGRKRINPLNYKETLSEKTQKTAC